MVYNNAPFFNNSSNYLRIFDENHLLGVTERLKREAAFIVRYDKFHSLIEDK